ncbi:hypothetical protein [Natrinema salinisoli]|uniref:hypothetical protein n=1 Tax=Natrinema salinisoli TaxID=2878535 RepID=UPI001CF024FB|nr:hypothetical protein [Natrinema salinisoli]
MTGSAAVLFAGPISSPLMLVVAAILVVLVLVFGRGLLALTWRVVLNALAIVLALWILAALGIGPF